jgi:type IV secretion system protein VirB11
MVTRTPNDGLLPFERELVELKDAGRYADFLRLAVRKHQTIVVSGKTGSGKTTFMKGLVEEVPKHERLITIQDTAELTLPNHPNVVHLFYSKDAQGTARVTAKSLLEACLRMKPDRIFLAEVRGERVFLLRAPRRLGPPGQHHQRARRQLRAGLRADVADDPRERAPAAACAWTRSSGCSASSST